MAFGQPTGPPATARQLRELLALLEAAGHADFRDARGPMGFTQRQAGGRFTRDEAAAFIEELEQAVPGDASVVASRSAPAPATRITAAERAARDLPDGVLAAELQRRGWIVVEP